MPTVDAFDIAWDSVYDIEKGLMDDFREARRQKKIENAIYHSEEARANRTAYSMKLRQLLIDTNGRPTREQLAAIHPDVATQVAEPEPAVEEIAPEGMSLEEANRIFDDDDSDDGGPPITEGRGPPDPPGDAVVPDPAKIVEEQISEPPGAITDSERLLPAPSERKTEQVSEPPKPPEGAVEPKPGDIVDTTKPLDDEPPTNVSELDDFVAETENPTYILEPLEDEPETEEQTGFRFPQTQDKLTGKKHKGGLREVQTRLTDDPMVALDSLPAHEGVPLVTSQGNPMTLNDTTGWYVKHGAEGLEYYHEDDPETSFSSDEVMGKPQYKGGSLEGGMKRPKQAGGSYKWPKRGEYQKVKHGKRHKIGMSKVREDVNVYYPLPDSHALDRKTGEKIASESQAADDAWTVVKNPHANPFTDFASVLAVNEEKPPERSIPVSDPIIMKEETPLQKLREKGFDMNEGDNLSLLPSNMLLNEDMGIQDNTSLLPAGWRNE